MTHFLAARNASLSAVKAVILTHHHPDNMGNAERLRAQAGATMFVHHDDLAAAMRKSGKPPTFPVWKPPVFRLVLRFMRNGVARSVPVAEASSFGDEEVLDVPELASIRRSAWRFQPQLGHPCHDQWVICVVNAAG